MNRLVLREAFNVDDLKERDTIVRRIVVMRQMAVHDKATAEHWNTSHPNDPPIGTEFEDAVIAWCDGTGDQSAISRAYPREPLSGPEPRPDDQENVGVDELVATSLPAGGSTAAHHAAKTDNGAGVTSAGGESGLPHRLEGQPVWFEKFMAQALAVPWTVSVAEAWLSRHAESLRTALASARAALRDMQDQRDEYRDERNVAADRAKKAEATLVEAKRREEEAGEDTKRLDWLTNEGADLTVRDYFHHDGDPIGAEWTIVEGTGPTPRAAIDAARAARSPGDADNG